ncbi:MAG: hypothetical protein CVV64_09205 [Candidatus Wallbacteria bacterium HGW-Wallbacteria-1]|uniref:DAGKc domain-containing protein n=1 Tax=Candidatus Wallbacteria bacterium HGW-Wallbacteria-1 TaxID=2013854 RepID=A0A2N1PQB5_9BACT|nr:MAG: hypothetical protein CVV64_09205 [Candidatus Wallbacteria bacterium HGW-Wallbacteria-1]
MRFKVLINPEAGEGRGRRIVPELKKLFYKDNLEFEPYETEKPQELSKMAAAAEKEEFDCVVAVGGDGTVRRVIDGIRGSSMKLAIIPVGLVNAFAKSLKIPTNIRQAIPILRKAHLKKADIGIMARQMVPDKGRVDLSDGDAFEDDIEETVFVSALTIGPSFLLDDHIKAVETDRNKRLFHILRALSSQFMNYSFPELNISIIPYDSEAATAATEEERIEQEMAQEARAEKFIGTSLIINNVSSQHNDFQLAWDATASGGFLEAGFLTTSSKMDYLKFMYHTLFTGNYRELPFLSRHRAASVKVNSLAPGVVLKLDREEFGTLPFAARIEPQAIEVVVK